MPFANIAIDVPLRKTFTYEVPKALAGALSRGKRVLVPFGRKEVIGVCTALVDVPPAGVTSQMTAVGKNQETSFKKICAVLDEEPLIDEQYLAWIEFAADYYCSPVGQALAQAMPSFYFDLKKIGKEKKSRSRPLATQNPFSGRDFQLTGPQKKVFDAVSSHLDRYYPALIHGITGSGKTEVYIELIRTVLSRGKSALLLVPEIGLTPQMIARLDHHFAGSLLVYHSSLTPGQRLGQWRACLNPKPQVMVGTRSSLFAPFRNLGLIIVDEEHDHSYKQEERFRYHARDLAVSRARLCNIPVVLGSATPSLESYFLTTQKKYHLFELHERIGGAGLPDIKVIDFGREREQTGVALLVSQNIHDAIRHFRAAGRQIMIFVGQRGFAQNAYCLACHTIMLCPNCSVGLKYHRQAHELKCHYCDYVTPFGGNCPSCSKRSMTLLGFGTQSIEEELKAMHPGLVIARIDSDAVSRVGDLERLLGDFAKQKIDLIIGTQMISKGHDFAHVGFVGILGIDAHLGLPDFRAAERAFQNLVQVAGRAGRAGQKGYVLVQSLMPEHVSVTLGVAQDFRGFYARELKERAVLMYPPFSRLIQFRFFSPNENRLREFVKGYRLFLDEVRRKSELKDVVLLGPAEMPVYKLRGKYRYHVLIKVRRGLKASEIVGYLADDLDRRKLRGLGYAVDVDAVSMV